MWPKYKYPVYLLLIALLCYWPLTFFQNSLLCDDIDVALPTKYFAGECYQHGILPLWNPYQVWGSPAHADLQYTNWSPEVLIVGILKGYDYNTLHVLFLSYLFLAGLGMYLLSRYLSKDDRTGFFIGCVYMLSGIVTGHVQSLVTILGLVWMPYVLLYFLKLLEAPNLRHTALLCVFSFLFMTLGYQAFAFMLLPLLFILFVWKTIAYYKAKDIVKIRRLLAWSGASLLIMGLLLSPAIITQIQSKPFVSRLNGMPLNEVMSNPFAPYGLVSLLNPLLTLGHGEAFKADITMRNFYMGLVPLLLIVWSFFKRNKTGFDLIMLMFAVVYLLGSFGDALPMRELMYYVLPFFKLFRFPSLLRIIVFICLLCYLSVNFKDTIGSLLGNRRMRLLSLWALLVLTGGAGIYALVRSGPFSFFKAGHATFHDRIVAASPYEIAFYLSLLQLLILAVVLVRSLRAMEALRYTRLLLGALVVDAVITIALYGQHTAFSTPAPSVYQANFARLQRNFPAPSPDPVADNNDKYNYIQAFWRNTGCYKKQLSLGDEWTSYYFTNFDFITNHLAYLKETLNSYPFIYFSNPKPHEYPVSLPVDTTAAFITGSFHARDAEAEVRYLYNDPNHLRLTCNSRQDVVLNIQQSYFSGWTIKVDEKPVQPLWNMGLLMSVAVPAGEHSVEFSFDNKPFTWCLLLSYGLLIILLIMIVLKSGLSKQAKIAWLFVLTGFCLLLGAIYMGHAHERDAKTSNIFVLKSGNGTKKMRLDLNSKADSRELMSNVLKLHPVSIEYNWSDFYNSPELLYALNMPKTANAASMHSQPQENAEALIAANKPNYITLLQDDFEDEASRQFTDTNSYNGSHAMFLHTDHAYSPAKAIKAEQASKGIYGMLYAKCSQRCVPVVVCAIKHADGREESLYFPLNKYLIADNTWQRLPFWFDTAASVQAGDTVHVFVMNNTPATLLIDDVTIAKPAD